jgi:hypothetical protein
MGRGAGQNLILKKGNICVVFILVKRFLRKAKNKT